MLTVFPVREEMRAKIPAIVHVEETARLQSGAVDIDSYPPATMIRASPSGPRHWQRRH